MDPTKRETEAERQQRIRADLSTIAKAVKAGRLPRQAIQRYVQNQKITPEQELANTPLSTGENIAGGVRAAYQGASFNFGDELMGTVRAGLSHIPGGDDPRSVSDAIADERDQMARFRGAYPKSALALELAGGVGTGIGAAKAVGGVGAGAGRLIATGAGSGAIAGAGAGETWPGRVGGAIGGLAAGAGLGYVGGKIATSRVGDAFSRGARRIANAMMEAGDNSGQDVAGLAARELPPAQQYPGLTTFADRARTVSIPARRAAARALPPDPTTGYATQRAALDELERQGMGGEALAMNVGSDRTVRAVRAAANLPGSEAGQIVNERLARQGGAIGEEVPRDIAHVTGFSGDEPGALAVERMIREGQDAARPLYEEARALGDIAPDVAANAGKREALNTLLDQGVPEAAARKAVGIEAGSEVMESLLASPIVRSAIRQAKSLPQYANLPDTDMQVLDKVYKNIGGKLAAAQRAGDGALAHDLGEVQSMLRSELSARAPVYGKAVETFREAAEPRAAFQEGLRSRTAAPGELTVALQGDNPVAAEARRAGLSTAFQESARQAASNADLGELAQFRDVARAVVGTKADKDRFIEAFGQKSYNAMLSRLMPKIRAAAQNAAARGNSTTAKQLMDALAFGDDAVIDALSSLSTGSPASAVRRLVGQKLVGPLSLRYRLGVGETAGETADLLTTQGTGNIRSLLDFLEAGATRDASRRKAAGVVTGAATRTATGRALQ